MENKDVQKQPFYFILLLILAGEAVFILPFVLARIFRTTFLETFELNNTQLGTCFSIYGIVALISYFFGGSLADRFSPRFLLSIALVLTALGGVYMATFPSFFYMKILFGYWGFTTIFLFWSAMIKATRIWGGQDAQGKAFGFLEAGRGLIGATIGLIGVLIFSSLVTVDLDLIDPEERRMAFKNVIIFSSIFVAIAGVLIFLFLKINNEIEDRKEKESIQTYIKVLKLPAVWFLMVIVLCAYVGYKTTDFIAQYAVEVVGYDEVSGAKIGTGFLYMRLIVAFLIGFAADRSHAKRWVSIGFITMFFGALIFALGILRPGLFGVFLCSTFVLGLGIYSTRALYFALLKEGKIPLILTGTAVGVISVIGYIPDIFMGPLTGYFLDTYSGQTGYQIVFGILTIFSLVGILATYFLIEKQIS